MKTSTQNFLIITAFIVIVVGGLLWYSSKNKPGEFNGFAQCLKTSGAVMYGTFWCSHCNEQKAMFGNSKELLPYVECSEADGKTQTAVCAQKGIKSYPTWEFADGSRESGRLEFSKLAQKTGCTPPE